MTNYVAIDAMVLRIYPSVYYGDVSLRMELYGCYRGLYVNWLPLVLLSHERAPLKVLCS